MYRGKRILLRVSTGFAIEVMAGGFYSVKLPNQAPYSRFAALSGCKQKRASTTPTKQLSHTRKYRSKKYYI